MFIVFEGLDGAGTTTQCERLAETLRARGRRVLVTREPSEGPLGTLLRQMLRGRLVLPGGEKMTADTVALWFAADRLDHLAATVNPAIAAGTIVISDRYVHSSLAYQGIDVDPEWVAHINERARQPDLTLFFDVPIDVCRERMVARGAAVERFEEPGVLERVALAWEDALARRPEGVVRIPGAGTRDEVSAAVLAAVDAALAAQGQGGRQP